MATLTLNNLPDILYIKKAGDTFEVSGGGQIPLETIAFGVAISLNGARVGGADCTMDPSSDTDFTYKMQVPTVEVGELTVRAELNGRHLDNLEHTKYFTEWKEDKVTVFVDTAAPQIKLESGPDPQAGSPFKVELVLTAQDSESGVKSLDWSLDGGAFTPVERSITLPGRTTEHKLTVRAIDKVGNQTYLDLTLRDDAGPELKITYPDPSRGVIKVPHDGTSATIRLQGTASDAWSGLKEVNWSLDGGTPKTVDTIDSAGNWSLTKVFGPADAGTTHRITVVAVDNVDNETPKILDLEVARPYKPRAATDLVSVRAYLQDLLEFSETHFKTKPNDTALRPSGLIQAFHQPFDRLAEPEPTTDLGNQPVNQLRLAVEVLRRHLNSAAAGLVAHWRLDEGTGERAVDVSGNGHHGILHNTTRSSGRTGGMALHFNGIDSYVEIANPNALVHDPTQGETAKELSISAWIYPTGAGQSNPEGGIIINKEDQFEIARFQDGSIRWAFANSNPGWAWHNTGCTASQNTWSHVAVTYRDGVVTTYLNGQQKDQYRGSGPISHGQLLNDLRIGDRAGTNGQHFQGRMEDVRIYRVALDAAAVAVLAEDIKPPALLGHWPCNEQGNAVLGDASPNSNTGALSGGAALTYVAGRQALSLDGAQARVEIPNSSTIEVGANGADFSVAFWLYLRSGSSADPWRCIMHKGSRADQRTFAMFLWPGSDSKHNHIHYRISCGPYSASGPNLSNQGGESTAEVPLHSWTHIAYVKGGDKLNLWINGKLDSSVTLPQSSVSNQEPLYLGCDPEAVAIDGALADVRVHDGALSAFDVAVLAGKSPSLLGHWPCDEQGGAVLRDASAFSSAGALSGGAALTYVAGRQALSLDGKQARAEIAHTANLEVGKAGADFSVALWLYLKQDSTGEWRSIVHQGNVNHDRTFAMWMWPDKRRIHFRISCAAFDPTNPNNHLWNQGGDSTSDVPLNTWKHIAYVKKGGELSLYIDGVLDSSVALPAPSYSNNGPLYLGSDPWHQTIDGALADVRVYGAALSAGEVAAQAADLAGAEARYCHVAYEAFLKRLGTSYEEIRLARGADEKDRENLAARLGITLTKKEKPEDHDEIDQLLLRPDQTTEGVLEELIGLADTRRDPFEPPKIPKVLDWQLKSLRSMWLQEDRAEGSALIVDPDVIGLSDLRTPEPKDKAFELWTERSKWLQDQALILKQARAGKQPVDGLNALIEKTYTLSPGTADKDFWKLVNDQATGIDIRPGLALRYLAPGMFRRLVRVRALTQRGTVTDDEWAEVDDILLGVMKAQEVSKQADGWRAKENGLALSPDYFVMSDDLRPLPRWRLPSTARMDWQDRLQMRIDQKRSVEEAYWSMVSSVEEVALPLLRDALVAVAGLAQDLPNPADGLTEQLMIDCKGSGSQQTTRIMQAIETIQVALTSLRMERFAEGHLAKQWYRDTGQPEAEFDEEWRWMGSYASWRAAMLVFFFPENALMPGLLAAETWKDACTVHFKQLVTKLREKSRLRPQDARSIVNNEQDGYLTLVKKKLESDGILTAQEIDDLTITDQMKPIDFLTRRNSSADLIENHGSHAKYWKEIFYFAPMLIALQLQKSREFVAALDWYQTVYAFNLRDDPNTASDDERKIYYPLTLEQNTQPHLSRVGQWLLDLNPHSIASARPNPYTRYTLMCIARCFLEYADSEFTRDTGESLALARDLYLAARRILQLPDLQMPPLTDSTQIALPNPVLESLRWRVENQLAKLRQGRNIAGMKRQVELPAPAASLSSGLPAVGASDQLPTPPTQAMRPTPYRYHVVVERSKQLANIAQQMEANYLSLLEKRDAEEAKRIEAGFRLDVAKATDSLQALRVTEASDGKELAKRQKQRAQIHRDQYEEWIEAGLSGWETATLASYQAAGEAQKAAATNAGLIQIAQAATTAASAYFSQSAAAFAAAAGVGYAAYSHMKDQKAIIAAQTAAQISSIRASQERREEEWKLQRNLADQDYAIGEQQEKIAGDHVAIVTQEQAISTLQTQEATAIAEFLARKFTNVELYQWMSGVLAGVYSYFLQQATSMAQLAQTQLAFERQTPSLGFVQADYWEPPAEGGTSESDKTPDRRGMTGAERLLADIYRLDQYAFENDRRKLNLSQTFSLAQLAPFEFQRFRETGILPFATPTRLFDAGFPGHYLRLIKRVRTSVVALIPPAQGIRATLVASGVSRTVVGGDVFQEIAIRRDPEVVALNSPMNATGVFELDAQPEMLLPFEAMGVDTSWEFQMPKAANPFDFNSIADVLVTIEYTALHSFDYRQQVIKKLNLRVNSDRAFSLRDDFPDAWYDLHHPEESNQPLSMTFEVRAADFPPNLEKGSLGATELLMYIARTQKPQLSNDWDDAHWEAKLTHTVTNSNGNKTLYPLPEPDPNDPTKLVEAIATPVDGIIGTKRGNAFLWRKVIPTGLTPVGQWTLTFTKNEAAAHFQAGDIEDILFIITFAGRLPAWPE